MKQTQLLESLIRRIVREEFDMAVEKHITPIKEQLNEVLNQRDNNIITHDAEFNGKLASIKREINQTIGETPTPTQTKNQPSFNLKNKMLNEVLNNTTSMSDNEEPVSILDQMKPSMVADYVDENTVGNNATTAQVPANSGLEAVFKKDYSALMKAMDEKKNFRP
tara:strand:- start:7096 stop:7590 length:495 start_codon:yes stop_codon:yes gene_type:complete